MTDMQTDPLRPHEESVALPDRFDAGLWFIGRIRTPWTSRAECPKRGDAESGPACRIELDPRWTAALEGVARHEKVQVLYWMHLSRRDAVRQNPHCADGSIGTFAIRSPLRPNPIASSVVRLMGVEGTILTVRGLDCVDGTPLIDLKPEFGALWCDTSPQSR
ncbi:virR [Haematobacter missouriensis]|uniref:tRNA (N6-threonylcarbamoyladenosine(37)-N6)-methyltransferase TrmO n=1 Tax=Haematobacter missouriensis TaxID=366616 RepID=A0A212AQF5_9RHOB|nr:SAM-dependent methyltransferase [Haematobacter missouriensis]KFI25870.1 virR [Haematobacter missouriensis]OWJ77094.1 tRNA (N6-threonylcarbamoyladenosine(37)-N6)-methyltransferase TrmO [Haematobacter missouriensis]OWJ83737.1 tRNA (N6-threonylcarbamoyladenosine(37)-N6)-methyltransferase TrmO [Haematobacter missouriensis]